MKTKNVIKARGKLVRIWNSGRGYGNILIFMNLPGNKEATMTFTLDQAIDPDITIGTTIEVDGHIKSSPKYADEDGKWKTEQYFVADKVKPSKTKMELMCGVKGHFFPEHFIRICLVGAFVGFYDSSDEWGRLVVATASNTGTRNSVMMNYNKKGRLLSPDKFMKGDEIAVICDFDSKTREIDGQKVKFENIFANDIIIVNKGDGETIPVLE